MSPLFSMVVLERFWELLNNTSLARLGYQVSLNQLRTVRLIFSYLNKWEVESELKECQTIAKTFFFCFVLFFTRKKGKTGLHWMVKSGYRQSKIIVAWVFG